MLSRRSILQGASLGAGSVALSPFLRHLGMLDARESHRQLPKRFVFVVKGSGLQGDFLEPEGCKRGGDQLQDVALAQAQASGQPALARTVPRSPDDPAGPQRQDVHDRPQLVLRRARRLQGDGPDAADGGDDRRVPVGTLPVGVQPRRAEDGRRWGGHGLPRDLRDRQEPPAAVPMQPAARLHEPVRQHRRQGRHRERSTSAAAASWTSCPTTSRS